MTPEHPDVLLPHTAAAVTSRADVVTATPDRYAKQLVAHLGRKITFTTDGTTSSAMIGGAAAQVVVGDGMLTLVAVGNDEQAVAVVEQVLGSRLERFGQRQELTVVWVRQAAAAR